MDFNYYEGALAHLSCSRNLSSKAITNLWIRVLPDMETVDPSDRTLIVEAGQLHILPSSKLVMRNWKLLGWATLGVMAGMSLNIPIGALSAFLLAALTYSARIFMKSRPGKYADEEMIRQALLDALWQQTSNPTSASKSTP